MALSSTAITPVVDPNSLDTSNVASKVYPPQSGTTTSAADLASNWQKIENQIFTLKDVKFNKTGGTITGTVTITPVSGNGLVISAATGSNQNAIQATGDGIGPAIIGTGGVNAAGASFSAGGGDNFGGRGIGSGNEVGWEATGGTGGGGTRARPGTPSTSTAPTFAVLAVDGGLHMDGVVSPNANVDPGVDFAQFPQSMPSSSALLASDGIGGFTIVGNDGFNVASWSGDASGIATVVFARALPGNNYRMHVLTQDTGAGYFDARWNGVQNAANYQFKVRDASTNAAVDLTATTMTLSVTTVGF